MTDEKSCAAYMRSWAYSEAVRRRLQNYTGGIFRLNTLEGVVYLEIGGTAQAVVLLRENASTDVFSCFRSFVESEIDA
jgi:hypothetical protein